MIGDEVAKMFLRFLTILPKIIKVTFKIMMFTGTWILIPYFILPENKKMYLFLHTHRTIDLIIQYFIILFCIYITIQSIVKIIKKDTDFRFIKISLFKKNKEPNPIIKEMQSKDLKGFIFGKKKGKFILKTKDEDGHILVIGGAGSGKSSCIAIPSLLAWDSRIFAIDIKGELSEKSNNFRISKKIFNPNNKNSFGYNPFYILETDIDNRVQNAKDIALALVPLPQETKEPFWIQSAQNLLTGSILYFSLHGKSFIETMIEIQSTPVIDLVQLIYKGDDVEASLFVTQFLKTDERVIGGIFTELSNKIMIFATDSQIKESLSRPNFITPEDIENGFDIFISIQEHRLEQWKSLLTLICTQFLKHFERRKENNKVPILFMLDEFARLGKIDPIVNGLATLRSKKISICILTQSLAQLDFIYGKEQRQVIADNCSYKAILKATDADTQDYFSRLVGMFDKEKKTNSANFEEYTGLGKGTGKSKTTEEKRIIKPENFAYLEDIVLLSPKGYMRVEKTPYYNTNIFKSRL